MRSAPAGGRHAPYLIGVVGGITAREPGVGPSLRLDLGFEAGDFGLDHLQGDELDGFGWCDAGTVEHVADRSECHSGVLDVEGDLDEASRYRIQLSSEPVSPQGVIAALRRASLMVSSIQGPPAESVASTP